jgi:hypothetical protein
MKKLAVGLMLCLAFNVAQAAPQHGGNPVQSLIQWLHSKLSDLKGNIRDNIQHVRLSGGGGGGTCR